MKKIGLLSSILISIGIVIGFGIFFKVDDILLVNGGHPKLALLSWLTVGIILMFGAYAVGNIAHLVEKPGGLGSYITYLYNRKIGFFAIWYITIIYTPIFIGLLSKYFGIYFLQLLGLTPSLYSYLISFIILTLVFLWNVKSINFAMMISNFSTVVKVIPLVIIFLVGLFFSSGIAPDVASTTYPSTDHSMLIYFILPFVSMMLTFDGWIAIAAMRSKMHKPTENLPKTFVLALLFTTIIYIAYFAGVSLLLTPSQVIAQGDGYITYIFTSLFGPIGTSLVLTLIIISGLGSLNGFFLSGIGYLEGMAYEKQIPGHQKMQFDNTRLGGGFINPLIVYLLSLVILGLYFIQDAFGLLAGIVIDDLLVVFIAVIYLLLFVGIIYYAYKNNYKKLILTISSIIAGLGQLVIIVSYFILNSRALFYFMIVVILIILGYILNKLSNKQFKF